MADVQSALLQECRNLLPWEDEWDARARIKALGGRSPAELEGLLARVRRTQRFDEAVRWLNSASVGLPRALFEGALLIYRDSALLSWDECVKLARLLSWPHPRFREWNIPA